VLHTNTAMHSQPISSMAPADRSPPRPRPALFARLRDLLRRPVAARPSRPSVDRDEALLARLDEAGAVWATHLDTVRRQTREATDSLLAGFSAILETLDDMAPKQGSGGDDRIAALARSESELKTLLGSIRSLANSREAALETVGAAATRARELRDLSDDVLRMSRQTGLVSVNAAVEAARAGESGRGFAAVAAEVRRLSVDSARASSDIVQRVDAFESQMRGALLQAADRATEDARVTADSERKIASVLERMDATISGLDARAAALAERGARVRDLVEGLLVAFQFQDRVDQITAQVGTSIAQANALLRESIAQGRAPEQAEWRRLLEAGYTTDEQRETHAGGKGDAAGPRPAQARFF